MATEIIDIKNKNYYYYLRVFTNYFISQVCLISYINSYVKRNIVELRSLNPTISKQLTRIVFRMKVVRIFFKIHIITKINCLIRITVIQSTISGQFKEFVGATVSICNLFMRYLWVMLEIIAKSKLTY